MEEIIKILTAYGHSLAKAYDIASDAKRGDSFAVNYVGLIRDIMEAREKAHDGL